MHIVGGARWLNYPPVLSLAEGARAKVGVGQRLRADASAVEMVSPIVYVGRGVLRSEIGVSESETWRHLE